MRTIKYTKECTELDKVNQYRFKGQESINNQANTVLISRIKTTSSGTKVEDKDLQYLRVISHLFYVRKAWVHDN